MKDIWQSGPYKAKWLAAQGFARAAKELRQTYEALPPVIVRSVERQVPKRRGLVAMDCSQCRRGKWCCMRSSIGCERWEKEI